MADLLRLFWLCLRTGLFSFGGGAAIVPLIRQSMVAEGFMTAEEAIDMVAVSEMTPGPFAVNAATFAGNKLAGFPGAVVATLGMVLPSVVITLIVARFLYSFSQNAAVKAALAGIRPVVLALIAGAALAIAGQTLFFDRLMPDIPSICIALVVFVMLWRTKVNPALLLALCGVAGALFLR